MGDTKWHSDSMFPNFKCGNLCVTDFSRCYRCIFDLCRCYCSVNDLRTNNGLLTNNGGPYNDFTMGNGERRYRLSASVIQNYKAVRTHNELRLRGVPSCKVQADTRNFLFTCGGVVNQLHSPHGI